MITVIIAERNLNQEVLIQDVPIVEKFIKDKSGIMEEIYREILEIREINKATKNYSIIMDIPRSSPKFKSESFWTNPPRPMILEFNLKKIPLLWSRIGIIIYIIEEKKDEITFMAK